MLSINRSHPRRSGAFSAAAVSLALFAGCALFGPKPDAEVSLVDLNFTGMTLFETTADVAVRVENRNPDPITVEGGVHRVSVDGTDLGSETCVSSGFAGGQLECSPDTCLIDTSNCKEALAEDFEGGALPAGWSTISWTVSTGITHAGTYAFRSGFISDYGLTTATVTVQADTPGSISFYHQESTESGYDYLIFYVDSVERGRWAGTTSSTFTSPTITAGSHTLRWTYAKDSSVTSGSDTVWIDNITAPTAM